MISASEFQRRIDRGILYYLKIHSCTINDLTWHITQDLKKHTNTVSGQYIEERIADMLLQGVITQDDSYHTEKSRHGKGGSSVIPQKRIKIAGNHITASQAICNILSDPDRGGEPMPEDLLVWHMTENMREFSPADVSLGINMLLNCEVIQKEGNLVSLAPREQKFLVLEEEKKR